jgi:hypothetical protein
LAQDRRHRGLLLFLRRILDVPLGFSKADLVTFRSLSSKDYSALTPLIDEYVRLADRSDTDALLAGPPRRTKVSAKGAARQMHLFDLLRSKKLFKYNSDLADFAGRVLPRMSRHRFDKMSRGDIAARIIEYLETRDPRTREELENSMRSAMESGSDRERRSFLSEWEKIIKGIQI